MKRPFNEKISIYHGMASTIAVNFSNNFFAIFAITILGATNYQVGLISSLPPLVALIMTVPAAMMLNRAYAQKKLVAISALLARLMFLFIVALVYLPEDLRAWAFLLVIAFMSIPNTIANIGWQTLISGMISDSRRGEFFSDRNRLLTMVGLGSTLIIGVLMKDASGSIGAYQTLFSLALGFGLLEGFLLMKHQEASAPGEGALVKKKLMEWSIFRNTGYIWFLAAALFFNFAWQLAWGIFNIYHVRVVGATIFWISMFSVGNMLMQILTFPLWKKWSERKSTVLVFVWAAVGMATTPVLTVLSTNLYYLTTIQTINGFFLSGVVLLLFNLLLEHSPEESRTYCITTYNVLLALVAFVAPQIGIWMLNAWGMNPAMYIDTVLRLMSAVLFYIVYVRFTKRSKLQLSYAG